MQAEIENLLPYKNLHSCFMYSFVTFCTKPSKCTKNKSKNFHESKLYFLVFLFSNYNVVCGVCLELLCLCFQGVCWKISVETDWEAFYFHLPFKRQGLGNHVR